MDANIRVIRQDGQDLQDDDSAAGGSILLSLLRRVNLSNLTLTGGERDYAGENHGGDNTGRDS